MNFVSKFKKVGLVMGSLLLPVAMFAQEGENPIDLSAAADAADDISSALSTLLTGKVLDALLVVLGALVVLWVVRKIPSWIGAGRA